MVKYHTTYPTHKDTNMRETDVVAFLACGFLAPETCILRKSVAPKLSEH